MSFIVIIDHSVKVVNIQLWGSKLSLDLVKAVNTLI